MTGRRPVILVADEHSPMDAVGITLVVVNLALAFGVGWPLAKRLAAPTARRWPVARWLALLLSIYLAEGVAFSAGMATNVFSIALAVVWGIAFGIWLRGRYERSTVLKHAFLLTLYTCLPAVSFAAVLVMLGLYGWPLLSTEAGFRFGIPDFVPWPFNTLLGFFAAVVGSAVAAKMLITMGEVSLLLRGRKSQPPPLANRPA